MEVGGRTLNDDPTTRLNRYAAKVRENAGMGDYTRLRWVLRVYGARDIEGNPLAGGVSQPSIQAPGKAH